MSVRLIKLNVIKKNRKYFACTLESGYKCKLLVDSASENIELGEKSYWIEDISVRTKYGTDLIYKITTNGDKKESKQDECGIVTLKHHLYNKNLVENCRNLGGKWDSQESVWVFDSMVESEVDELDILYNDDLIVVDIIAKENLYECTSAVYFCGYKIAAASGRDSGASLAEGVVMIDGEVTSSGSMKNWNTKILDGSKFRIKISKNLLEKNVDDYSEEWEVIQK